MTSTTLRCFLPNEGRGSVAGEAQSINIESSTKNLWKGDFLLGEHCGHSVHFLFTRSPLHYIFTTHHLLCTVQHFSSISLRTTPFPLYVRKTLLRHTSPFPNGRQIQQTSDQTSWLWVNARKNFGNYFEQIGYWTDLCPCHLCGCKPLVVVQAGGSCGVQRWNHQIDKERRSRTKKLAHLSFDLMGEPMLGTGYKQKASGITNYGIIDLWGKIWPYSHVETSRFSNNWLSEAVQGRQYGYSRFEKSRTALKISQHF